MNTKSLPPHGTYARANGCPGYREPCKCEPCLNTRRAAKKRERVNRQLGRATHRDPAQTRARLAELNKTMGWEDIAKAAGTSSAHLREIASGRIARVKQTTHAKIMAIEPEPTGGQYIDATGAIRQVRALQAIGHSVIVIAEAAATHRSRIMPLVNGHPRLRRSLAVRIDAAYNQLASRSGDSTRSRNRAARECWAPPGAWDEETISDPDAHPEWTGYCGTDRGWWTHTNEGIPMCPRCETAHAQWLADRRDLPARERFRQLALAKGAASNRGANLAHDARELLSYGIGIDQAAERLGVTRNHLQQELLRHPAPERTAA